MSIALIGGMDRLERHYIEEAKRAGMELRVFTRSEVNIGAKLRNFEGVVIFTNKVSHQVKNEALSVARANGIPVFMHHSCGVCTLRECLRCLQIRQREGGLLEKVAAGGKDAECFGIEIGEGYIRSCHKKRKNFS